MRLMKVLWCSLLVWAVLTGCAQDGPQGHTASDAPAEDAHGHAHGAIAVTLWTEKTELFMEHPVLVAGEPAEFLAHLTDLKDFSAVTQGRLVLLFQPSSGTPVRVVSEAPSRPGIFIPTVVFKAPGRYTLELRLEGPQVADVIRVGDVLVHPQGAALPHEDEAEEAEASISFLKEQQWKIDFRTVPTQQRALAASVQAVGEIVARPQGHATVPALVNGVLLADQNAALPSIGSWVEKGQVLAVISPPTETESTLLRIRNEYVLAEAEYKRANRLFERKAIAEKRLEVARLRYQGHKASYDRIAQQVDFSTDKTDGEGPALHFHVKAPIDGVVEEIHFHLGQTVPAGAELFTLTNPQRVWLKAQLLPTRLAQLQHVRDAVFRVEGSDRAFQVSRLNGRLVSVGSIVDPISRTVPVLFEVDNPDNLLKINLFANVAVHTGERVETLCVPLGAVLDEDGQPVVYVQTEGEAFVKRTVETGIEDDGFVQIQRGLTLGERVVSTGAYQVRLASLSTSVPTGHGHAH